MRSVIITVWRVCGQENVETQLNTELLPRSIKGTVTCNISLFAYTYIHIRCRRTPPRISGCATHSRASVPCPRNRVTEKISTWFSYSTARVRTRGVREPENVGSGRDENFSRDRDGFPRVSGFVLLGLTDACTSENQQRLYTFLTTR